MTEIRGRLNPTKERLMTVISEATAVLLPKVTHIIPADKLNSDSLRVLPLVSVRINPVNIDDKFYDRIFKGMRLEDYYTGGTIYFGSIAVFSFTAHVHTSANSNVGEDRNRWAQELADKIINKLTTEADNLSTYGIEDIFDVKARESTIAGLKLGRVIISGKLLCTRYDNTTETIPPAPIPPIPTTFALTVNSIPAGINFTFDALPYITDTIITGVSSGLHTVVMPSSIIIGGVEYHFSVWEDLSINPTRIVNVTADGTITATYVAEPAPPEETEADVIADADNYALWDDNVQNILRTLDGTTHVFYLDSTHQIAWRTSLDGITWSAKTVIETNAMVPCIAIDSNEYDIHLTYNTPYGTFAGKKVWYRKFTWTGGHAWTVGGADIVIDYSGIATKACVSPTIDVDANHIPHILWYENNTLIPATPYSTYYQNRIGGAWSVPEWVGGDSYPYRTLPNIAIYRSTNLVYAFIAHYNEVYVRTKTIGGAWSGKTVLMTGFTYGAQHYCTVTSFLDQVTGDVYVVGTDGMIYVTDNKGGSWGSAVKLDQHISLGFFNGNACLDDAKNLHIAVYDGDALAFGTPAAIRHFVLVNQGAIVHMTKVMPRNTFDFAHTDFDNPRFKHVDSVNKNRIEMFARHGTSSPYAIRYKSKEAETDTVEFQDHFLGPAWEIGWVQDVAAFAVDWTTPSYVRLQAVKPTDFWNGAFTGAYYRRLVNKRVMAVLCKFTSDPTKDYDQSGVIIRHDTDANEWIYVGCSYSGGKIYEVKVTDNGSSYSAGSVATTSTVHYILIVRYDLNRFSFYTSSDGITFSWLATVYKGASGFVQNIKVGVCVADTQAGGLRMEASFDYMDVFYPV